MYFKLKSEVLSFLCKCQTKDKLSKVEEDELEEFLSLFE